MDNPTLFVKNDQDWEPETARIVEALHESLTLRQPFGGPSFLLGL